MKNENPELAPWQWPEDRWREIVERVRAGRSLRPAQWQGGARCAVALSFDSDHETNELREAGESIGRLSQRQYGNRQGIPRILDILKRYDVRASFFVPAVTALLYPGEQRRVAAQGHEIGIHGWIHERNSELPLEAERDLQMRSADVLERVAGVRPVGIRTPSWDFSPNTLAITREMGLIYDSSLMADVFDIFRREFDAAYREGGLFQLTMHPHISGYRSRVWILEELIRHIQSKKDVWFATHRAPSGLRQIKRHSLLERSLIKAGPNTGVLQRPHICGRHPPWGRLKPLAETTVRQRLAAILAADVAGYSRLMGGDERATVAALDSARDVFRTQIEFHQGRVIDMAGDSVLAVFDTATGAVGAALAVQEGLVAMAAAVPEDRQMRFRIGVHLGDVMEKADGTVYGDGVNIAARLEGLAEPGGITVSDAVQGAVRGRVSATFADQGEQQVKNIVHTVHAYRLVTARREAVASALDRSSKPSTEKPSIAVLPFANMSGDPEQEYFADGISEDIITGLSKLRWFFVIARNSSFAYKGKADDVKRVARELGVRYVLEGSVRKGGNRVRITAQLIDASTGSHIWADRYDGDLTDIFALQDEITKKVVAAIEPKLLEAEGIRSQARSAEDLGAWDMVISANSLFWRLTKAEGDAAIAILQRAVERYPNYAPAHSMLAFDLLVSGYVGWSFTEPQVRQAASLAARAAELDNSDPWAHLALGYVAHTMRRTDEAVEEFQRALELNPNFAAAHGYLGLALALDGRSDQAIAHSEQAIRMSPHDPQNAIFNVGLAVAHYLAGRYTEAVGFGRKALQLRDGMTGGHRIYCASLAQAGQVDEARAALTRLKELLPEISIAWIETYVPYTSGQMAKFLEGMRKAGLQ